MVKFITYKGTKYPVRIGYFVLKMVKAETGKSIEDASEDLSIYETILFYALQKGARVTGQEFSFTKEQMEDVLEECLFEFIALIPSFFPNIPQDSELKKKK